MLRKLLLCAILLLIGALRLPAQTPPAPAAPPSSVIATIPFAVLTGPSTWIPLNVKVNGHGPYLFILDTGASQNVITPDLAAEAEVTATGKAKINSGGKKLAKAGAAQIAKIEIGAVEIENTKCFIIPMPAGTLIRGIIGSPLFAKLVITVDYQNKQVILNNPATFAYKGKGISLPLDFDPKDSLPLISGELDGAAGRFRVDTGDDGTLELYSGFVKANALLKKYASKLRSGNVETVTGAETVKATYAPTLTLGKDSLAHIPTRMYEKKQASDASVDGNLGGEILSKFTVTFDYPHKRIYLEPNANYAAPFSRPRCGFTPHFDRQGWVIRIVEPRSPAEEAGLKAGDRITRIEGKDAAQVDGLQFLALARQPAGTELRLTVQSGKKTREITLILKDYD